MGRTSAVALIEQGAGGLAGAVLELLVDTAEERRLQGRVGGDVSDEQSAENQGDQADQQARPEGQGHLFGDRIT